MPRVQAQASHTASQSAIDAALQEQVSSAAADRADVQRVLANPEVKAVADAAGIDLRRASTAVASLDGEQLSQIAAQARQVDQALAGGQSKIVISTTVIIIALLVLILLMYLVLGCLMDALAMIILTVPIIFPVIKELGFDPIWFGVIIVMTVELGLIHPPVGMNIFVIKSVVEDAKIVPTADGKAHRLSLDIVPVASARKAEKKPLQTVSLSSLPARGRRVKRGYCAPMR